MQRRAMELVDWQRRWENDQIAFHRPEANALLVAHLGLLRDAPRVLVPLAGKSVDMIALAEAGHHVVGVEGSELACNAFFAESRIAHTRKHDRYRGDRDAIEMVCGDFFEMTPRRLGMFDGAWDKAALIAVDPELRPRYVDVLRALLRRRARVLLATFSYDQRKASGPPWSLDRDGAAKLFTPRGFVVEPVASRRVDASPRLREGGVQDALEELLLITKI